MIERNAGRIINVASEAGIKPYPELIPYGISKTSLITLSRGLAEVAKGTNVTVNSVLPGPTFLCFMKSGKMKSISTSILRLTIISNTGAI
ncbi:hypothetical protein PUR_41820 [Paenibacillus sp. URB8-2]|nr:hypothetical protein PUR_41820 [Paenibacillus sp. URB8-2]